MFPDAPKVKKSTDYARFQFLDWNRAINQANLKKLIEENEKNFQLHKFPILIDSDFNIIDGQHRFTAAQKLGAPVYFIQEEELAEFQSVTSVNRAGKTHTMQDMIQMSAKAGNKNAVILLSVHRSFGCKFDLGMIARLFSQDARSSGRLTEELRDSGSVAIPNQKLGMEILTALDSAEFPDATTMRVAMAIKDFCKATKVPAKNVVERLNKKVHLWRKTADIPQAIELVLDLYNHGLAHENKVFYSKWTQ